MYRFIITPQKTDNVGGAPQELAGFLDMLLSASANEAPTNADASGAPMLPPGMSDKSPAGPAAKLPAETPRSTQCPIHGPRELRRGGAHAAHGVLHTARFVGVPLSMGSTNSAMGAASARAALASLTASKFTPHKVVRSTGAPPAIGGRWCRRTPTERNTLNEIYARCESLRRSLVEEKKRMASLASIEPVKTEVAQGREWKSEAERLLACLSAAASEAKNIEEAAVLRFHKDHPAGIPDTPMAQLYGDILREKNWVIDPGFGVQAPSVLVAIEEIQAKIRAGTTPSTHPFANITSYFVYDESLHCVVMLQKIVATGQWAFSRYYQAAPFTQVMEIFTTCRGSAASSLPTGRLDTSEWVSA